MSVKQLRVLAIVATDSTYEPAVLDGKRVWVGKCIHCNRKLTIADDGTPLSRATIEHIWPRNHGGANDRMIQSRRGASALFRYRCDRRVRKNRHGDTES